MTPVVIIVYNRPTQTRALIDALRPARPPHVIVIADGPRPGDPRDDEAVARTRAELAAIDWPCRVEHDLADVNLGCNGRIRSGLDATFERVDRAIILEDDIHPHPSLFAWMGRMLDVHADRDDVAMLCGHNPLIRWAHVEPGTYAVPSRRGGIHGWATWARAWRTVQHVDVDGPIGEVDADIDARGFESSVAALYRQYLSEARTRSLSWDVDWTLRMAMSGRIALVSPVNLVHHDGVGPDATHHVDSDDTLFRLPRLDAPVPPASTDDRALAVGAVDQQFDRASILLELLVRARDPRAALRLARHPRLPLDAAQWLHLLPFVALQETLDWLDHLATEGLDPATVQRWLRALGGATARVSS